MKNKAFVLCASVTVAASVLLSACHGDLTDITSAASTTASEVNATVGNKTSESQTTVSDGAVSVYFPRAGQNAEGALISAISTANKTLDVAIYSFTDTKIADAIASAKKRGVMVRMMTDRESSGEKYQKKALNIVKTAGIPIKDNTHSGIMHLKVSIIDSSIITTGSFNYTGSAQTKNDENLVILHSSALNARYETEFNRMWNDTADYAVWNG